MPSVIPKVHAISFDTLVLENGSCGIVVEQLPIRPKSALLSLARDREASVYLSALGYMYVLEGVPSVVKHYLKTNKVLHLIETPRLEDDPTIFKENRFMDVPVSKVVENYVPPSGRGA